MIEYFQIALLITLFAFATESITEIIVASKLLEGWREWLKGLVFPLERPVDFVPNRFILFIATVISCGYCTSVWVAMPMGLGLSIYRPLVDISEYSQFSSSLIYVSSWITYVSVIHRLSNLMHVLYGLTYKGRIKTHDLAIKVELVKPQIISDDYGSAG